MSKYDLPAQLELIKNVTGTHGEANVAFIGHSMGGTMGVLYPTLYPDEAAKHLKISVALGPGLSLKYNAHPLWWLVRQLSDIAPGVVEALDLKYILAKDFTDIITAFCTRYNAGLELCANMIYYIMGPNSHKSQVNPEWFPTIFSHSPGGTPTKVFLHYMQNAKVGKFQPWDYGRTKNLEIYNSTEVPEYKVENIKVPLLILSGTDDIICSKLDSQEIFERIKSKNAKKYGHFTLPGFNHFDYIYGKRIDVLNKTLVKFLNKIFKKRQGRSSKNLAPR